MSFKNEIEEFEKLLKVKNEDYFNKYFKSKKNVDKTMKQILKEFFLETGQLFVRINIVCDCLEKYKENKKNTCDENKLDAYISKMNKLYAVFCLAIDTFEEIKTEIFDMQ